MRIILVPAYYLPKVGGVEIATANLAKELVSNGHQVSIVTTRYSLKLPRIQPINGITVFRLPFFFPHTLINTGFLSILKLVLKWSLLPVFFSMVLIELIFIFQSKKPHIVNLHYIGANAFYILMLRKLIHFPLVVAIHGADIQRDAHKSGLAQWLIKKTLCEADKILVNSKSLLFEAEKLVPYITKKSIVVGNGVNLDEFVSSVKYKHPKSYILSVGRFVRKKGLDVLIQAFAAVVEVCPKLDLIIAGDGEELTRCKSLALQLGIDHKTFFVGTVDRKKVIELLIGCEIFVLPSRKEPFGIVILEAMAAGKPVIATNVGGVAEIVKHLESGFLVESESPAALAQAINLLLKDKTLRKRISHRGYRFVRNHFSWKKITEKYIKAYENVYRC